MPIDENTIFEVRVGYTANGQQCYNVWHLGVYAGIGGGDGEMGWTSRVRDFFTAGIDTNGKVLKEMRDAMSEDAEINEVAAQIIFPIRYRSRKAFYTDKPGTLAEVLPAQNVAAVFTKYGELGDPSNIGSFHLGGLAPSMYEEGLLSAAGLAQIDALKSTWAIMPVFTIGGETTTLYPGILNKIPIPDTDPVRYQISGLTEVIDTEVQPTLRVMRRRTVRVGI